MAEVKDILIKKRVQKANHTIWENNNTSSMYDADSRQLTLFGKKEWKFKWGITWKV